MDALRFKHIMGYLDFDLLTDWEQEFVESVERQFKARGGLSEKQWNVLEKIFRKQNEA